MAAKQSKKASGGSLGKLARGSQTTAPTAASAKPADAAKPADELRNQNAQPGPDTAAGEKFPVRAGGKIDPFTLDFCRAEAAKTHWPIGLCIAWVLTRDVDASIEAYARRRQWDVFEPIAGWRDAQRELLASLEGGKVEALAIEDVDKSEIRRSIPALEWLDLKIVERGPYDEIRRNGSLAYRDARVSAEKVQSIWPRSTAAQRATAERASLEEECVAALKQRMQGAPDRPIPKAQLRREFPKVSERGFNRAWTQAVKETGAKAWAASGRRRHES